MNGVKLLIVEDNEDDLSTCKDTIERYIDERNRVIDPVYCKDLERAVKELDNSFDGAIIDLKLASNGDEGNKVIAEIDKSFLRIPVAILTGTPDTADASFSNIGVFKKGDPGAGYVDLFDIFWGIHNTGLTRIMGGRGIIEETLSRVFHRNLLPQKDKWVAYGEADSARTEKALLRHSLNHLLQLLDEDGDRCFPEEMYMSPPLVDKIQTGSIVKSVAEDLWFAVLSPACDLAVRSSGEFKTNRILLVEIENEQEVLSAALDGITKAAKKITKRAKVCGNGYTKYYHWLPKTDFYAGGFLNFRKLITLTTEDYDSKYERPAVQISPSFVKDIVARFSSYCARQGQPDIDLDGLLG